MVQKYFDDNPMMENGLFGYAPVAFNDVKSYRDDIVEGQYMNINDKYVEIEFSSDKSKARNGVEFYFQRFREFVVIRYWNDGVSQTYSRAFSFSE